MKKGLLILTVLGSAAFASVKFFDSSGASLGNKTEFKCGTGLSCSVVNGQVVGNAGGSSLTLADSEVISNASDVVSITADDAAADLALVGFEAFNAYLTLKSDQSDDNGDDWQIQNIASTDDFIIANDTSGSQVAKLTMSTAGNISLVGTVTGDGGDALSGFLQARVLATATTITAAQCGSTFYNGGAVEMELPEASTVLGCRLTFIVANASNFHVDPDAADQILVETDAAGDRVLSATLGTTITLEALSASQWAVQSIVSESAWSDAN